MIKKGNVQLPLQTVSLVLGFMVWVILSSLMPYIKEDIALSANQIALVTATPVLFGSLLRIPFGYWTNRFGARNIFAISFLSSFAPVLYLSWADSFTDLIIGGLFLGIAGGVFSVGVTSLPKYYPKERHGFVNGIYGLGNMGTALSTFGAPILANKFGWSTTILLYMILLGVMFLANFMIGDKDEPRVHTSLFTQIKGVYKSDKLWFLCLFYFLSFGSFVAFSVYLPNFLVSSFNLTKVDAGMRTAGFIALATFMRPLGGWLADRFNPFRILLYVFAGLTLSGIMLSFAPSMKLFTVACLTVGFCAGLGNGTIFKLVPLYFTKQAGIANGLISALGGIGGFFPPLMLAALHTVTGHYAIGFMSLSMVALASLLIVLYMYFQDRVKLAESVIRYAGQAVMVTNKKGIIQTVNLEFTEVTGYEEQEVLGKSASILKSGRQSKEFYDALWNSLRTSGFWEGDIWNKRKNGEIYHEWLTISPIRNEVGEISYYVGIFREITAEDAIAEGSAARVGS